MKILTAIGLPSWFVAFAVTLAAFVDETRWLCRRRRNRQPGLNTVADADAFVEQLHAVSTEPVTPLQHRERDLWVTRARTTPLVAHLAAQTRHMQITMTRSEIVWDTRTPIYDSVVADFRRRRDQAERRRRALDDPTGEFRALVSAAWFDQTAGLIGRPPLVGVS